MFEFLSCACIASSCCRSCILRSACSPSGGFAKSFAVCLSRHVGADGRHCHAFIKSLHVNTVIFGCAAIFPAQDLAFHLAAERDTGTLPFTELLFLVLFAFALARNRGAVVLGPHTSGDITARLWMRNDSPHSAVHHALTFSCLFGDFGAFGHAFL